ncbi:sister chromatid cohesion protein [Schizosaccharomyces japonicus yFS275]|uniref:Sister chromatid cohesion protein n=1 Tax=Schizosaccharomyces japonicus (strain yFS275 / FY16936) TaxID=402676 RepID=B6JUU7_SCHJY|nr:sister chromatid cohesion protein [Schizosaccharomyces japonicus yFS275]EEB05048.1 sister chromatid cohesion protein [Schizosaccharomyces japonicus yFS275]
MPAGELQNENPQIKSSHCIPKRTKIAGPDEVNYYAGLDPIDGMGIVESAEDSTSEPFDAQEVFDLLASINDPEHPLTLAQLSVVNLNDIEVVDNGRDSSVTVHITPTIPHCSMCTLIGLCIRVRLQRCLPPRFRVHVYVKKGTHASENQVNKQLNDKERVAAACENEQLLGVLNGMMSSCA